MRIEIRGVADKYIFGLVWFGFLSIFANRTRILPTVCFVYAKILYLERKLDINIEIAE